jgi:hypothetical protein
VWFGGGCARGGWFGECFCEGVESDGLEPGDGSSGRGSAVGEGLECWLPAFGVVWKDFPEGFCQVIWDCDAVQGFFDGDCGDFEICDILGVALTRGRTRARAAAR